MLSCIPCDVALLPLLPSWTFSKTCCTKLSYERWSLEEWPKGRSRNSTRLRTRSGFKFFHCFCGLYTTHILCELKFLHYACMLSCLVMSNSLLPEGLEPVGLLCPWDSPGKNTGVSYHALLQGIFLTQELNPISFIGSIGRWVLYYWATREALN